MINIFYLTILRFSFGIIFSIFLLGEGKSILSSVTEIKNNKKTKQTLINIFITPFNFANTCFSLQLHISFNNFKLRHICVFSIKKIMKSKKNLVLLGMMGSGKSTIGNLISKKLKLKFIDIDNAIEKKANMNIAEIFSKKGENFFRNLEEKITIKSLESSNNVISLGGGGFINEKIRKEVITNNFSFWLNWSNATLLNRIKNSHKRPIAFNFK